MFINLSIAQKNEVIYSNSKLRTGDNVGVVQDGVFITTIEKSKLLEEFAIIAKDSGWDIDYDKVEIKNASEDGNGKVYGLFAYSKDELTKTAIVLDLINNVFLISKAGATISCHSLDCTGTQCSALNSGQGWICTSCTKSCSKTTTVVIKAVDHSLEGN